MQFILTGFTQDLGFRVFAFDRVAADRTKTAFTVRADLAIIRTHGIRIQELPLLCRGLLERLDESEQERTWTFTEEGVRLHADNCAAILAAMPKRKTAFRPKVEAATI